MNILVVMVKVIFGYLTSALFTAIKESIVGLFHPAQPQFRV
jgi:uncharacterized membrane protein (DUF106 family)